MPKILSKVTRTRTTTTTTTTIFMFLRPQQARGQKRGDCIIIGVIFLKKTS